MLISTASNKFYLDAELCVYLSCVYSKFKSKKSPEKETFPSCFKDIKRVNRNKKIPKLDT